jgi:hypothetical protein
MERYCQNSLCENEAVKEVPVSMAGASDQKWALCRACKQAYDWGVRHGRMTPNRKRIWVLAVADRGIIVHGGAFSSKREAVHGLAEYLRTNEDYTGPADMPSVSDWLAEHDERLGVDIFPASLEVEKSVRKGARRGAEMGAT